MLRRREDGYHEVKMIMQTIGLHDDLEIRKTKTPGIQVKTNLYYLPTNENNLVYKAAKLLMGISVSTKFVYENLHANDLKPEQHPDVDSMIEAMRQKDLGLLCSRMGNVLETVTIPAYPVINEIKRTMIDNGAIGSMMSGSGPTVFGIFDSPAAAKQAMKAVRAAKLAKQICLTTPYNVKR